LTHRQIKSLFQTILNNNLSDQGFIKRFKSNPKDFTRNRKFEFKSLFLFITSSIQSSIQRELDSFFQSYLGLNHPIRFISQSAFSQARLKIKPEAFVELNKTCVQFFYDNNKYKKWKTFRLIAIDGTEVVVPKTKETIEEYGEYTTNLMNNKLVLTRVSKAYDVLNDITLDAKLVNRKVGEHTLAGNHLELLGKEDLVLLDRGYPSFNLFRSILESGCQFCARVPVSNWNLAKELVTSQRSECIAEIKPGNELRKKYKEQDVSWEPIQVRFVRVKLKSGEDEVLITSLLDTVQIPHEEFKQLYHLRWGIEELYKTDKHRLKLEDFSGKSVIAIQQDFLSQMLLVNFTSILTFSVNKQLTKKNNKYDYKVNRTSALSNIIKAIPIIFADKGNIETYLIYLWEVLFKNTIPIRPGRNFKRIKNKRRRYYRTYATI